MRTALLAAVVLIGLAAPASAYRIDEDGRGHSLRWAEEDRPVRYWLAAQVPDEDAGREAVHRAAASWSQTTDRYALHFAGAAAESAPRNDGRNLVAWIWRDWPFDPTLVATTARHFRRENGRMLDADTLLNAQEYRWGVGGPDRYDIESTVAHELGHIAGLGHSEVNEATMLGVTAAGETHKRSLEDDDRAGLTALYGEGFSNSSAGGSAQGLGGAPSAGDGSGGGCSVSREGGDPWAFVLVAGLVAWIVTRNRRQPPPQSEGGKW